jgi:5-methylcytosine-specific restriction protein A
MRACLGCARPTPRAYCPSCEPVPRPRGRAGANLRVRVLVRALYRCEQCHAATGDLRVDHIVPLSKGGSNALTNMQALCEDCHDAKTAAERLSPANGRGQLRLLR